MATVQGKVGDGCRGLHIGTDFTKATTFKKFGPTISNVVFVTVPTDLYEVFLGASLLLCLQSQFLLAEPGIFPVSLYPDTYVQSLSFLEFRV